MKTLIAFAIGWIMGSFITPKSVYTYIKSQIESYRNGSDKK